MSSLKILHSVVNHALSIMFQNTPTQPAAELAAQYDAQLPV
jgi:hypothetical protein